LSRKISYLIIIALILAFSSAIAYAQNDTSSSSGTDVYSSMINQINAKANALREEVMSMSDKADMIQMILIANLVFSVVLMIFIIFMFMSMKKNINDINSKIESSSKSINDTIKTENEKLKHRPPMPQAQFRPNIMPFIPQMPPHKKVEVKPEIHHPLRYPQKAEAVKEKEERTKREYKKSAIETLKKDLKER